MDMVGRSLTQIWTGAVRAIARGLLVVALVCGAPVADAAGNPADADICRVAARRVSQETGVPVSVLEAISLTETGRKTAGAFGPWPWTVNMEGAGHWFDSAGQALDYARTNHGQGKRSFDVGCFQLNYKWHGEAFASIEEMFDPIAGARYAADFLTRLYNETGDWSRAAGAYHSRTPENASRYRKIFDRHYAALSDGGPTVVANANRFAEESEDEDVRDEPMRQNNYPLLVAVNQSGRMGSLVPLGATTSRLIPLQTARALQ